MNKPARVVLWAAGVALLAVFLVDRAGGAPTYDQTRKAQAANRLLLNAGNLFKEGKFAESAELVKKSQNFVAEVYVDGDRAEAEKLTADLRTRLDKARQLLAAKNVTVPEFRIPDPKPEKPVPARPDPAKPNPSQPAAGTVSFTKQIAPLLVAKCGGCHVSRNRGMLSMATFEALMKGNKDGPIVLPGKGTGSRIAEVIESGDMPRGGGKVGRSELAMLVRWIDEGAKFDGASTAARLTDLASAGGAGAGGKQPTRLDVAQATGNEKVLFSRDIAPILAESCASCHGGRQPRAGLSVAQFAAFVKGGDSGTPWVPGKPAESLLIQKLKGTAAEGARMPLNKSPLSADKIALVETWIVEGARYDGPDPAMPIDDLIALAIASRLTHDELSARRSEIAQQKWRLGNPDRPPVTVQTKNFQIFGLATEQSLQEIGERAEAQAAKVAALLKAPVDEPLLKGRQTLYIFQQRFNYAEFGQMVEKRELPSSWRGHWFYNLVDAYGCVMLPKPDEDEQLDPLLAQQIAGAYVASLGKVPRWFSEGSARAVAAKLASRDPRVAEWDSQVAAAVGSQRQADDFLTGKLGPEQTDLASYGFVAELLKKNSSYQLLLKELREGQPFEAAFATAYRATPQQWAANWAPKAARRR